MSTCILWRIPSYNISDLVKSGEVTVGSLLRAHWTGAANKHTQHLLLPLLGGRHELMSHLQTTEYSRLPQRIHHPDFWRKVFTEFSVFCTLRWREEEKKGGPQYSKILLYQFLSRPGAPQFLSQKPTRSCRGDCPNPQAEVQGVKLWRDLGLG